MIHLVPRKKTMAALLVEFVPVPVELKGFVIGKHRAAINEMIELSGATIDPGNTDQAGFTIVGNKEGIEMVKQLISEKLAELNEELIKIPDKYKGRVIGKWKANLRKIETQTGVKLFVREREVFIVRGTEQQRRHAKISIGTTVARARVMDFENELYKVCSYVDGCHLPMNCKLKLEEAAEEDCIPLQGSQTETQYRLKPAELCEREDSYHDRNDPVYQSDLGDEVLMSLRKIKNNMETAENPKADMWCHLGTSIIRAPDEDDDVLQQTWGIEEITEKFQRPDAGERFWKVSFRERDDITDGIFKRTGYTKITEGDEYICRYDLTYLTPCFYQLRCKVGYSTLLPLYLGHGQRTRW